jgi:hypothetical protein
MADVAILLDFGTGHNMGEMPDPGAPPNSTRDIDAGRLVNQDLGKRSFVWHGRVVFQRLAWLLMTITPALGTAVLIKCLGVSLDSFTPTMSDEIGYYLQINAFVHHGFSGGYFTISETPAPAAFSHFGVHGPLFPLLYGVIGKLVGWEFRTGPFINILLLTLAIAVYCMVIRPTVWQALLGAALLATFWPFYLCVLSVLQDPVHWAIAILVGTGFCGMLRGRRWAESWSFRLVFLGLLIYASLMRISWAMFLIPYVLLQLKRPTVGQVAVALVASGAGIGVLLYAFRWLCAPYVGSSVAFLMNKMAGGEVSAGSFFRHAYWNIEQLLLGNLSSQPMLLGSVIFWQAIAFGSLALFWLLRQWAGRRLLPATIEVGEPAAETLFHAFNIWFLLVGIILFYFVGNDGGWRMLAVHLLVSAVIAITSPLRWLKAATLGMVLVNAGGLPWYTDSIQAVNRPRFQYLECARAFRGDLERFVPYEAGADPWQNTILIGYYPVELLALPAGIGVSFFVDPVDVKQPIKSKYVLAHGEVVKQQNWRLKPLVHFSGLHSGIRYQSQPFSADLYLNPGVAVSQPHRP